MIQSSSQIKDILFDCLNSMSENPWIYTDQDNQFLDDIEKEVDGAVLSLFSAVQRKRSWISSKNIAMSIHC